MQTFNLAYPVYCHSRATPSRTALVVDRREHSYGELAAEAARVAGWLRGRASRSDRAPRVGILASRSFETYAGILGAAWAGCTYVPLNPRVPSGRLALMLRRADLDAVIVDKRGSVHLSDLGSLLPQELLVARGIKPEVSDRRVCDWDNLPAGSDDMPPANVGPNHPAYILFTSGTTGVPKGVVLATSNVAHFLSCIREQYHFGPEDRVGQFSETSFDVSVFEMFACWDGGASLHVVPENMLMAPAGFIREHALTVWSSVPSVILMLSGLNFLKPGYFPSLRISYFAGEGLPVASARAWKSAAINSLVDNQYGPTEATITCIGQLFSEPPVETEGRGTLAIGRSYPGMQAAIVSPEGKFLDAGQTGELALSGPQLALGYLDEPEQTSRRFPTLNHPTQGPSRWYLTGDLARQDSDGRFHHLGRIDSQVKVLGNRVELEEIEAHLRAVCGTDAVATVAWPVMNGNAAGIVAFICGGRLTPSAARAELAKRVPHYMVPGRVITMNALPLSTNGKIDRQALISMLNQPDYAVAS
jgi:amino acid adenylation domain-containing protein